MYTNFHKETTSRILILYTAFSMIDWLCLKQPKIKDQNSGSQLMLMRVTLEKPQRDGSFNFRQTNFKDFSGENYSFSRRLVKFNIFSRLSEP